MRLKRKTRKVRGPMRDNSRSLSVRMTEGQHQRLITYLNLTRLNSTTYFRNLIHGNCLRGRSKELNYAMHASVNKIHSNVQQILRHQKAGELDSRAVSQMRFLADKLCEEAYLLSRRE